MIRWLSGYKKWRAIGPRHTEPTISLSPEPHCVAKERNVTSYERPGLQISAIYSRLNKVTGTCWFDW